MAVKQPAGEVRVHIESRPDGEVHWLTIDREARLNVLDSALMRSLTEALAALPADGAARVAVLRGAGERAFIGGADIDEMSALDADAARAFIGRLHGICATLRALPCATVAAIDGYCLGGGMEVAAACDIRLATTRASFAMPEVHVGIPSVIDAALLPGLIGHGRARELVMTGRAIGAEEAHRYGFVTATHAPGESFEAAVRACADALLRAAPRATAVQKVLCNGWDEPSYSASVAASIEQFAAAFDGDEPRARMRAFIERRRKPAN